MKFRVIGSNRETAARMVLEFEAESKAAAERKATQSGMAVNRVEEVTDGPVQHADAPSAGRRRSSSSGLMGFVIFLIVVAFLAWWFYFRTHGLALPMKP